MKTVLALTCLAFALAGASVVPSVVHHDYKVQNVEADFAVKQEKILKLFIHPEQIDEEADYYKIGKQFDFEAHMDDCSNKKAVQEFWELWKSGFMPRNVPFSIFYERQREEAVALFHIFYYAKDFEAFYKYAAWARVHVNEGQFLYAYYIALIHRADIKGVVVPAPYEVYPELFVNSNVWHKIFRIKMQNGLSHDLGAEEGVLYENDRYIVYANYSDYSSYHNDEHRISYFVEDVGLNAYYYYFHSYFPFWMDGDLYPAMKERRGEVYYYFYQQLLARYYLERLSNGLGEIPQFSWWHPIKSGYSPYVDFYYSFVQRPSYYEIPVEKNIEELQLLDAYEKNFIQFLEQGHFKAFNQDVDLRNSKSINFVGNFWQANADWHGKFARKDNHNSYEVIARRMLSAAPEPIDKYNFVPSALDFYQSSLRDPMFYQLYSKILKYFIEYKKFLAPYSQDVLHYVGVKINDIKVNKLVSYFDYYDIDVSNNVQYSQEELKSEHWPHFIVRQPRLNHKNFSIEVNVKSDVESDAVVKIFLGPKYDSRGYPISLEDNWLNFVELDWSVQKLVKGQNKIVRDSENFFFYKEDSVSVHDILKHLPEGKVPSDMSIESGAMPKRLILPKGSKGGFPYQLFVIVYPYAPIEKKFESIKAFVHDNKPFGYPFDRPVHELHFKQPNMYFEDVEVYHEGEEFAYKYSVPNYFIHNNEVINH